MRIYKIGGLILSRFGDTTIIVLSCYISCIIDLNHVWQVCHCLGRGRTSVNPTGHARFSVQIVNIFWKL